MATLKRTSRSRPRRDTPLARSTVLRGTLIFVVFGIFMYFSLTLYNGVPGKGYEHVSISVPTVGNLLSHDAVRIGGKRIGQVQKIDLGNDGRPRIDLQLTPGTKLPKDTTVTIRANGLLGARYVQLVPGKSSDFLADGATIRGGADSFTNGVPEFVDTFDEPTRKSTQDVLRELSTGFVGTGGALNGVVKNLAIGPPKFGDINQAILDRKDSASRLITSLNSAMGALEPNKRYNRPFLQHAADAASPFVTERKAVQDTLSKAPAALAAATDGLTRGRALLRSVREFASAAAVTLPPAPQALGDLSALMAQAPGPLRRLKVSTDVLLPAAAEGAKQVLRGLDPMLPRLNTTINLLRPQADYLARHGCDVINFGSVMRSMTGFGQAGSGPAGPAMAFRLELVAADPASILGVKANEGDTILPFKRDAYEAPCKYLSQPYPLLGQNPLDTPAR
ncbi:MAG: phospholipid/cholesterol/gamma-HCH transport system substrate-binding protein [Solirubrobacteraceae bacterium]|jgi:virulence factor Mce-like protein|nr:phospholipid/cholesterol/gamma-HCH transport system substrate-binding protein [Solirubrobacteraceae bacterium]